MCRKLPGTAIGKLCEKCDGKCVICDSYVRPDVMVRICDECNYGSYMGKCCICGNNGISDAYYCKECTMMEKDRDGCPKIVNLGSSKTDLVRLLQHSREKEREGNIIIQDSTTQRLCDTYSECPFKSGEACEKFDKRLATLRDITLWCILSVSRAQLIPSISP
jgi:PHD finger-like domain-containing protein 5A